MVWCRTGALVPVSWAGCESMVLLQFQHLPGVRVISHTVRVSEGPREVCKEEKDGCPSRRTVLLGRESVISRTNTG